MSVNVNTDAIGCLRVSTTIQADGYGFDRQRQDIQREADRNGLHIVAWLEDTVSGAVHERAAVNEYYERARQHPGLNFIFSHPNRVGRHIEVTVGIARQIHAIGGTVWIAELGNLRDRRAWGHFLRDAVEAETDYANIIYQMRSGKQEKALAGRWPHGAPPAGYQLERDARGRSLLPVPMPEHVPTIQRIFDLAERMGSSKIYFKMLEEGRTNPSGNDWSIKAVKSILDNHRYTGVATYQGIKITYPAIITQEQFERVQAKIASRVRHSGPRDTSLLWSGHVRCAVCGSAMGRDGTYNRYATRGQHSFTYYRCWAGKRRAIAQKQGKTPCTHFRSWRIDRVDEVWWAAFVEVITDPVRVSELLPPEPTPPSGPPPAEVEALETAIARAWEPFAAGKIPEGVAERLAAPYVERLQQLRAEYDTLKPPPSTWIPEADFIEAVRTAEGLEVRRELLDLLDAQLYIGPEGIERITLNPPRF